MKAALSPRIVLAGGTGFLGEILSRHFLAQDRAVTILTRGSNRSGSEADRVRWDGRTLGAWIDHLEGAAALINLAGCSVDCRYHPRNRRRIMDSRIDSTRILGEALARCSQPPRVWMNSSTATIYKHTFGEAWDERGETGTSCEAKDAFSVEVAKKWEWTFFESNTPGVRKTALRSAMVLGVGRNSVFPVLRRLARFGFGGAMAGGNQFVSWIHEDDFCRAIDWLLECPDIDGRVNLAAPNPLANRELMRTLRRVCGAPLGMGIPSPAWLLEIGAFLLRTETELVIKSRRVVPARLTASGFEFRYHDFAAAAHDLESRFH